MLALADWSTRRETRSAAARLSNATPSRFRLAFKGLLYGLLVGSLFSLGGSVEAQNPGKPGDWAHWRGPELNGTSRDQGLPDKWSPKGENLIWSSKEFASRSTPVVMNGRVYLVCRSFPETTEEGERTICVDAESGKLLWESVHNVFLSDGPAERVGWSSVVGDPETDRVYVLGLGCLFQCLDGKTGEIIWERSLLEEYGMLSTYGGRTNFPVVFEDLVIISGVMTQYGENAVPAHRFIAFEKSTGEAVWLVSTKVRPEDTTYSTPVFTTFNGEVAMVFGAADGGVYAIQPRTGKTIWKYDASTRGMNTTPLVHENIVYCGHSEKNRADTTTLGAIFAFDGRQRGEIPEDKLLWKVPGIASGRSSPIFVDGRVYFVEDGGTMVIADAKTGKVVAEKKLGQAMFGAPIYVDGKIHVADTKAYWILEPTAEGVREVAKVKLPSDEVLTSPVVSQGRIYLATSKALYCIGAPGAQPATEPAPFRLAEKPLAENGSQLVHIQVTPVELILAPGGKQAYRVRGFNAQGQAVPVTEKVTFTATAGTVDESGNFVAPTAAEHQVVTVTAQVGELTSKARVRVIPPLPWKFTFDDKQVPATWIGAAYRHQPKEFDGQSTLVKISTIPKGTRSQSWMGFTTFHDYTIQGDFYATGAVDSRPDMGLINQRYTLDLMGKGQLQIRSWTPRLELRFAKTMPYDWSPGQWYTLKFRSETHADGVTLRGKVWKRGEAEPAEWTIEATDKTPNRNGSPGLFGNSSVAEFYIDNVEVSANK